MVVGAVIRADNKVLVAQRASGSLAGMWEFPGGKVESGETEQQALIREISEELSITIEVGSLIESTEFEVESTPYCLNCYWARVFFGEPSADEHHQIDWVSRLDLLQKDLAPADIPAAKKIANDDWWDHRLD
jgi:8-oxo-dGTP diphosphatase